MGGRSTRACLSAIDSAKLSIGGRSRDATPTRSRSSSASMTLSSRPRLRRVRQPLAPSPVFFPQVD